MALAAAPLVPNGSGGLVVLSYLTPSVGATDDLAFYVAPFDNDRDAGFPYRADGPLGVPGTPDLGEASVRETAQAIGEHWAGYYERDVRLYLADVYQFFEGAVYNRTAQGAPEFIVAGSLPPMVRVARMSGRVFYLHTPATTAGSPHLLWLDHLNWLNMGYDGPVTPTSGGVDARDQTLMGYLTSTQTAICGADGTRFHPQARVREWISS